MSVLAFFGLIALVAIPREISSAREPPQRPFKLEELFIEESVFPHDWRVDPGGPGKACISAPLGSGCRSYYARNLFYSFTENPRGGGLQEIHQYLSAEEASADFQRLEKGWFSINDFQTEWRIPYELEGVAPQVDQFILGCHYYGEDEQCQFAARYEEFVVRIHLDRSRMAHEGMVELLSYSELTQVIRAIDNKVMEMLESEQE